MRWLTTMTWPTSGSQKRGSSRCSLAPRHRISGGLLYSHSRHRVAGLLEGNTWQQSTYGEVNTCKEREEYEMTALSEGNVQANGITIHYYRTGGDKKPSILLLHGITDSGQCWPQVAHDWKASYDVIRTGAGGLGHSGPPANFSLARLADDPARSAGTMPRS